MSEPSSEGSPTDFSIAPTGGERPEYLVQLYDCLGRLNNRIDGPYYLSECDGTMEFPNRGLYFFFSPWSVLETDPAHQWFLTRIGTVGVARGSTNTLWNRLRQHRGNQSGIYAGGGNHRGSIFRQHVGRAFIARDGLEGTHPYWGEQFNGNDMPDTTSIREHEHCLETRVSQYIASLPFLYLNVPGDSKPGNDRARTEMNTIAMVSHARRTTPGLHDADWLGRHSPRPEISSTGLWNVDHVHALFGIDVLDVLEQYIDETVACMP